MRVFLAGATGAIGRPLTARLLADGHEVTAMTRSPESARALEADGAKSAVVDAFDSDRVRSAIAAAEPDVLIHQLTALPSSGGGRAFLKGLALTNSLRRETVPVMLQAAADAGARRAVVQSISFCTAADGRPLHDEDAPLWTDAPDKAIAASISAVADMERSVADGPTEGLVLRYGFYYGPGTAWAPDGQLGGLLRKRMYPVIGNGTGRMSFVHIDDAVQATMLAIERGVPGVYNVCEPDPKPVTESLTEAARAVGAKPPRRLPVAIAKRFLPYGLVHYSTTLAGNDSSRAQHQLGWQPAHAWPDGLR